MATDRRTYVRLHDGLPDHPKVVGLTDPAFRLFIEALCYCSRHLTDGYLTASAVKKIGPVKALRELASAGLLEEAASGWQIHDYLLHQRSAAEVEELIEKRRVAGQAGGLAKAKANAKQKPAKLPSKDVPETETQTETPTTSVVAVSVATSRRASAIRDFDVSPGMRTWAHNEVPHLDVDHETAKFVDHYLANGKPMKDWTAAWRKWMRNATTYALVPQQRPLRAVASTTDTRVSATLALAEKYREEGQ